MDRGSMKIGRETRPRSTVQSHDGRDSRVTCDIAHKFNDNDPFKSTLVFSISIMTDLSALLESSKALTAHLARPDLPSVNLSLDQIEAQSRRLVSRQTGASGDDARAYVRVHPNHYTCLRVINLQKLPAGASTRRRACSRLLPVDKRVSANDCGVSSSAMKMTNYRVRLQSTHTPPSTLNIILYLG